MPLRVPMLCKSTLGKHAKEQDYTLHYSEYKGQGKGRKTVIKRLEVMTFLCVIPITNPTLALKATTEHSCHERKLSSTKSQQSLQDVIRR